jgi:hypothetical protein
VAETIGVGDWAGVVDWVGVGDWVGEGAGVPTDTLRPGNRSMPSTASRTTPPLTPNCICRQQR